MFRIVLDTETLGDVNQRGTLQVYDFGYVVIDHSYNVVESARYLVKEVFCDQSAEMQTAYYADKLPAYYKEVWAGTLSVVSFLEIWQTFKNVCHTYNVKEVWAHNAGFDRDALNATLRKFSNGYAKFFLPYGIKWCCTQALAGQTICNSRNYFRFAMINGGVSSKGNLHTTAEDVYRYLSGDNAFKEEHTALADVLIELEILKQCKKQHRKADPTPKRCAWRYPQAKFKEWQKTQVEQN